ncbi:MAG: UDP-N-acetylglucosamine 2-epimerase (non-hydrolyzing) [Sediminibacterium sp.]|nr:MAG: UDP-N-acetylglucosamine 2-epimerase (non-hydrolyzing) [Sediminibacterium sp.] [Sediminibacterium sp. FEMGT703S]
MKIVTIIGARPQFIKAAVISRAIREKGSLIEVIVHTGQHFDKNMSDVFFEEMEIPKPDYNLNINGLTHGAMTGQMLEKIEDVLIKEKPDWVLVYGDTNSTLAGALAAKKLNIKLTHVEAGLRSFNISMPEEINRILTDRISNILFCPSNSAINNLHNEGYSNIECKIIECGDVMKDAAMFYSNKAQKPNINLPLDFVLCTIHRAENTDDSVCLKSIFNALEIISSKCLVVIPLHPRTKAKLELINYDFKNSPIRFISPVGYLEMVWLIKNCRLVMTDSGGLQKEAYFFNKYCITLRNETEWLELVNNNYNFLCGSNENLICQTFDKVMLDSGTNHFKNDLFGNGNSAEMIIMNLLQYS